MSNEIEEQVTQSTDLETESKSLSLRSELSEVSSSVPEGEEVTFEIPEQYKNERWTQNYKSMDDVWRDLSNTKYAVGKKTIGIPDWEKASESDIEAYYSKIRPKSADEYNLADLQEDEASFFKDVFFKYGISKKQADSIISDYKDVSQKALEPLYSKQALEQEFKNRFGPEYANETNKITDFLKKEANKNDLEAINKLPNTAIGIMYEMLNKVMQRYAVKDSDIGVGSSEGTIYSPKIDYEGYIKEMEELNHREHSDSDKIAIRKKYGV